MDEFPPPLPDVPRVRLLRGPLILTAISRVLMIPFYFLLAWGASRDLKIFLPRPSDYVGLYIVDKVSLAVGLWIFFLFSALLAWLFFARRRMFRPLMIYFSLLPILLFVGVGVHIARFPSHPRTHSHDDPTSLWGGLSIMLAVLLWPFYYVFSRRVKRVFTR